MPRRSRLETSAFALLIVLAALFMAVATHDAWHVIGRPWAGFPVMEILLVGVGGIQREGVEPLDLVRAVNGQVIGSSRELQNEIERHAPGTRMRYLLVRSGSLVEVDIPSRPMTFGTFRHYNRVYARTQALIDRLFFRARYNSGRALVELADAMTTTLDLDRLAALIAGTVEELMHPVHVTLFLAEDRRGAFRRVGGGDGLAAGTVLATCLAGRRAPLSREMLLEDPPSRRSAPRVSRTWTRCSCWGRAAATSRTRARICA